MKKNVKKYLALILMMFAMSTIYTLPYLRYSFFTALQDAMGLSNDATKYGNLMSVYRNYESINVFTGWNYCRQI